MPKPPVARLTQPAELVAALPIHLGYVPSESLVVGCLHEPRGRLGLTMRFDLPAEEHEQLLAREVARRVRHQGATRLLLCVYTEAAGQDGLPRRRLFSLVRDQLDDLVMTEAVVVRGGRFWSYLCERAACCPPEGTPVAAGARASAVQLIAAETAFSGRVVLKDREAVEASLAGPTFLRAQAALQRCEAATLELAELIETEGLVTARAASRRRWDQVVRAFAEAPGSITDAAAAQLAVSLVDVLVRDEVAAAPAAEVPAVLAVLEELMRRTPAEYDAPVCALFAWMTYCEGGGAALTIALERALASDPGCSLAHVVAEALESQVPPEALRDVTRRASGRQRRAG
jgi:hypothetical protein